MTRKLSPRTLRKMRRAEGVLILVESIITGWRAFRQALREAAAFRAAVRSPGGFRP